MKIFIKAKPGAKEQGIEKIADNSYAVSGQEQPFQRKANKAIISVFAEYFHKLISQVYIIRGHTSRQKILEIEH